MLGNLKPTWQAVVAVLLVIFLPLLTLWKLNPTNILFINDISFHLAIAERILDGELSLLGPVSHAGGRHLGPIYFWYLALGLWLSGGSISTAVQLYTASKLVAVFIMLASVFYLTKPEWRKGAFLACILIVIASRYLWVLRVPWHGHFVLIPAALTIWSTLLLVRHGLSALLFFLLNASLLVQTHFASIPFVLGTLLFSLLYIAKYRPKNNIETKLIGKPAFQWICAIALLLSWLPMLLYEAQYESNLLKLFFLHAGSEARSAGLASSLIGLVRFFLEFTFFPDLPLELTKSYWAFLLPSLFLVSAHLSYRYFIALEQEQKASLLALLSGVIFSVLALSKAKAPLHSHYYFTLLPIPALFLASVLGYTLSNLKLQSNNKWQYAFSTLACVFFFINQTTSGVENFARASSQPFLKYNTLAHAVEVSDFIKADKASQPNARILAFGQRDAWENAYHYFLKGGNYRFMQYSKRLKEVDSFKRKNEKVDSRQINSEKKAYAMVCQGGESKWDNWLNRSQKWKYETELSLQDCNTCSGCKLFRLRRIGNRLLAQK